MKIKKPVVGDIVIYEEQPSVVYYVNETDSSIIWLLQMKVLMSWYPFLQTKSDWSLQTNVYEDVKYPKWKYPEQTGEMIEVDDG